MMRAWAFACLAQVLLAGVLWLRGRRDWWLAYLVFDLVRSAALWVYPVRSYEYFYTWLATEPVSLGLQFAAVASATSNTGRSVGIVIAAGALAWSIALTSESWPTLRRGALMLRQAGMFGCAGALAASWAADQPRWWMLAYYAWQVLRGIVEQFARTPNGVEATSTVALIGSGCLSVAWARAEFRNEKSR